MGSLLVNASAQTALRQLRAVERSGQLVRDQISTGLKVQKPGDQPSFFVVAAKTRGDIAVQTGLRDNLAMLKGAVSAADAGLRQVNDLVLQISNLVPVAQNGVAVAELELVFDDLLDQIRDTIEASGFQGRNLLTQAGTTTSIIGLNRSDGNFKAQSLSILGGDFLRDTFFDGLEEKDGEFVINAENYTSKSSAIGRADGLVNEWVDSETYPGFLIWEDDGVNGGGGADAPTNRTDLYRRAVDAQTYAPRIDYRLRVNTPGTYYVNVRGRGQGGAADSIHVGFDGAVLTGTGGVKLPTNSEGWGTRDTLSNARVSVDVPAPGIYTLSIWGREDGSLIDGVQFIKDDASEPAAGDPLPPPTPISGSDLPYYTDAVKGQERRDRAGVMELLGLVNPEAMRLAPQAALLVLDDVRAKVANYQAVIGAYDRMVNRQGNYLDVVTDALGESIASLVEADLQETSSRLAAIQVQEQLAVQALTTANQRPSTILSLYR